MLGSGSRKSIQYLVSVSWMGTRREVWSRSTLQKTCSLQSRRAQVLGRLHRPGDARLLLWASSALGAQGDRDWLRGRPQLSLSEESARDPTTD